MTYFNVIGINNTTIVYIRCYQKHKFNFVQVGRSFTFSDLVVKGDAYWCVSSSTISLSSKIPVAIGIEDLCLPEDQPKQGLKRKLADALTSPQKSTVVGKIAQVSPLKYRRDGQLPVRTLALKDDSGIVKVALFEHNATMEYEHNSVMKVSSVYNKTYNQKKQLVTTQGSELEFLPSSALDDVLITDEDHLSDDDFQIEEDVTAPSRFTTDNIMDVAVYDACASKPCRKRKITGTCNVCHGKEIIKTCRVKLSITDVSTQKDTVLTIFENDVNEIFQIASFTDTEALITALTDRLPVDFHAKLNNGRLYFH